MKLAISSSVLCHGKQAFSLLCYEEKERFNEIKVNFVLFI